jgi:predicted enzyme related to lactoylglutathione lyase
MHTTSLSRIAKRLTGTAMLALGMAAAANAAPFPPINSTASSSAIPGKLVWADLFTSQPAEATKFYCDLFGWTSTVIDQKGKSYTVFSNDGVPVAGLAPHTYAKENHPSRWIGYISVADINATAAAVEKNGGKVHASPRKFPDRGQQAIVADGDGDVIGLLQSSSGDPADENTKPGAWNWFELYVANPKTTSDFYHQALNYDVAPETNSDRKSDFVLSSNGNARAGIAPIPEDAKDNKPRWLGVIRVSDLDQTISKVAGLGGEVLVAPHAVEYGSRFAIILDPTGGTIGLVQYVDSANPAKNP